jgi:hypothetical protein
VGLYGGFDAALIVGYNTVQDFVSTTNVPNAGLVSGSTSKEKDDLSPSFAVRAGLTWTPAFLPTAEFRTGYQFEQWYHLGHVSGSRGDLSAQGLFFNLEVGF